MRNSSLIARATFLGLPVLPLLLTVSALVGAGLQLPCEANAASGAQIEALEEDLQVIVERLDQLEGENEKLRKRLDMAEPHTATGKIAFGVNLPTRADTLHREDIGAAPAPIVNAFSHPWIRGASTVPRLDFETEPHRTCRAMRAPL